MKRGKREAKRAYGLGRRFLAMFLAMVMCTSMLQLTVFAEETFEDQVMDGYFIVDADGIVGTTTEESVTVDGFTLKKEIEQTGKDAFNITLTVQTSETITTSDAAIQLVIDNSSSMEQCADCGKDFDENACYDKTHSGTSKGKCSVCQKTKKSDYCTTTNGVHEMTRLEAIQNVLTKTGGFLDSLIGENNGNIYVSVVSFDASADKECEWLNINDNNPATATDNMNAVKSSINAIENGSGTNIQGGLMLARNRLAMDIVSNAANKYLVLLSDGAPYHVSDENPSLETIPGYQSGWYDSSSASSAAVTMANFIRTNRNTVIYAVGYGTKDSENTTLTNIAGSADRTFSGDDSVGMNNAFADIAEAAREGIDGSGTTVIDPMGQFITKGNVTIEGVTGSTTGLTWNLDPSKDTCDISDPDENGVITYTYSITYPITLNPAVEGFQEVYTTDETAEDYDAELAGETKYYPTNGRTYLSVPTDEVQEDGTYVKKLDFLVPGVCGEIPEVNWTIEYYLQNPDSIGGTATYTKDEFKTFGPIDVWTIVNAPDSYESKYASSDYKFDHGNPTLKVSPTGENVMRLYYNLVTEDVVVNHYYKTDRIDVHGTFVPGSYSDPTVEGPITCKVNSNYTATPQTMDGTYVLDGTKPNVKTIMVTENGDNVINLYYTRVQDERIQTSAQVNHVYRTYAYVLGEDGKYGDEPVLQGDPVTEIGEAAPLVYATAKYDVSNQPIAGYEDYTLNTSNDAYNSDYNSMLQSNGTLSFIVAENAADNVRTLYFDKVIDRRVPVTVTVNHYYTKSVTSVEDGEVVTTVNPDGVKGNTSTIDAYAGEAFTASEINRYQGDDYVSDRGNAGKLVISALPAADSVIDLYYTITRAPEEGSITVNHYWRTFTEVTVEKIDEETGDVIGTKTVIEETEDYSEEGIVVEDLFVGQKYTALQKSWGEGYFFNADASKITGVVGTDRVLNLYYDKWAEDDERNDATINVQHIYTTYLTTIVNGAVQTLTVTADPVVESFEGLAGDEFVAEPQIVYNGNEYDKITDDAALSVILQPGTNDTIVINYEREASSLVETNYVVNHVYKTYSKIIVDGVAVDAEPEVVTISSEEIPGYVGEEVTLNDGAKEGFTALSTNPATTQTLAASGNEWTFVHEKNIDLRQGSVTVNHHYSQQIINLDGTITWTSSTVTEDPVVKYLGETYTAEPVINGYQKMDAILDTAAFAATDGEYALTVSGNHVVDFHYKKMVDMREFTTYTVTHDYYLFDYDGTLLSHPDPMTETYTGYVAHPATAHANDTDYTLTEVTFNGEKLTVAPYTKTLVDGENAFIFTYEKTLPRDTMGVTVIHNYYKDQASMSGAVENQYIESFEIEEDEQFTAKEYFLEGAAYTYTFDSAEPAKTITVTDDGENVIIMNYIRATAEYEVIHVYTRNDVEVGRTSAILGGLDGEVILADSIERVPEYNGKVYTFKSITGDITLDADEMQTITLVYDRTTGGGGGGGGGTVIIPEPPVPQEPAPQPEPGVVIPDEDTPLVDLPEEEVPLADVPKTGDASALWLMMSVLSGSGLAGMAFLGRKKREEI